MMHETAKLEAQRLAIVYVIIMELIAMVSGANSIHAFDQE